MAKENDKGQLVEIKSDFDECAKADGV